MLKIIYPGSFDPPTNGHLNIIQRAASIYDEVDVVIAVNPQKKYTFTDDERFEMMKELVKNFSNVSVHMWDRLIVVYAEKHQSKIILRGVRGVDDFSYEFQLSMINKGLKPSVETIFMTTDPKYFVLRSSAIKELVLFGGDISAMVPRFVADALRRKMLLS
jgi:pantetheine-phosphate adenylyltransferase